MYHFCIRCSETLGEQSVLVYLRCPEYPVTGECIMETWFQCWAQKSKSSIYPLFSPAFPLSAALWAAEPLTIKPPDWEPVTPLILELWRSEVGQIPKQAQCHPFQLGPAAAPPYPASSQHGQICRRLIRRRQESQQGRTSEYCDANVVVVE